MTTTPTTVFLRLSGYLFGRDRTLNLQAHRELAQTFAVVAPLGGGAVVSLQALGCDGVFATNTEPQRKKHAMKTVLVAAAFGLATAIVMPLIPAPSLGCQAGCNKLTSSEQIELQPAWTDCGVSLECLR
jgi:hypothetical protein